MKLRQEFLEDLADAAVAEGLADAVYSDFNSPVGRLLIVESNRGLCRIGFVEEAEDVVLAGVAARIGPRVVESRKGLKPVSDRLAAYFEGDVEDFTLPVDFSMVSSEFGETVLRALVDNVKSGHVTTYGHLADIIGRPRAARAVGTALGRNPIPIVVPCHRVLPSSGGVGNYGGGPAVKRFLLGLEGALPEESSS